MRSLQRSLDLTVLYVTHCQAEALALSDCIVVMDKGRISQSGSSRDLYDRPETRFAANFVGTSNCRETVVRGSGDTVLFEKGNGGSLDARTFSATRWNGGRCRLAAGGRPRHSSR